MEAILYSHVAIATVQTDVNIIYRYISLNMTGTPIIVRDASKTGFKDISCYIFR